MRFLLLAHHFSPPAISGFLCDDVPAAVAAAEATGSGVQVPVNDKGVAFVRDPDGYWVEFRPRGWKSA